MKKQKDEKETKKPFNVFRKPITYLLGGFVLTSALAFAGCSDGVNGKDGKDGANGVDGSVWHSGTEVSQVVDFKVGDYFFDTDDYDIYKYGSNGWELISNIKGEQGEQGPQGEQGEQGETPTIAINEDGYWVINGHVTDVSATGQTNGDVLVTEPLSISDFKNKKITILGDSITAGVGANPTSTNSYVAVVGSMLDAQMINKGSSGTTMSTEVYQNETTKRTSRLNDLITYVENYVQGTTDYFIVALGTNDYDLATNGPNGGVKLGTLGSEDTATIYGAANVYSQYLQQLAEKGVKVYFMTPIIQQESTGFTSNYDNSLGYSLRDVCDAIIESAAMYDIPTLDMNILSGIYYNSSDDNTTSTAMNDGLHPNNEGHALMANALVNFLLANYSYEDKVNVATLTLQCDGQSTVTNLKQGTSYKLPTPSVEGKTFIRWMDSTGKSYSGGSTIVLNSNISLQAIFDVSTLPVVSFINLYGGSSNYSSFPVEQDETIMQAMPDLAFTNSYGLVSKCYLDEDCTQEVDLSTKTITENTNIYVSWETDVNYFVVSDVDGAMSITGVSSEFTANKASFEKIIFPKKDLDGNSITTLGTKSGTDSVWFQNIASSLTNLSEMIIPEGYVEVKNLFMANNGGKVLTNEIKFSLSLPASLTKWGMLAFVNVPIYKYIVDEGNTMFSADENGILYSKDMKTIYRYPTLKDGTTFEILEGVNTIHYGTFYGVKTITEVTIPSSVTKIYNEAFEYCSKLLTININCNISVLESRQLAFYVLFGGKTYSNASQSEIVVNENSKVYVKDEQSKQELINILLYDNINGTGEIIQDDFTDILQNNVISKIEVMA